MKNFEKLSIGLLYFNKPRADEEKFEVLDGQQRTTSLGRYLTNLFSVEDDGHPKYFDYLSKEKKNLISKGKIPCSLLQGSDFITTTQLKIQKEFLNMFLAFLVTAKKINKSR